MMSTSKNRSRTAGSIDTLLVVLLEGDAGLGCGEILASSEGDVVLTRRKLCVRQSDWNGHSEGGRVDDCEPSTNSDGQRSPPTRVALRERYFSGRSSLPRRSPPEGEAKSGGEAGIRTLG